MAKYIHKISSLRDSIFNQFELFELTVFISSSENNTISHHPPYNSKNLNFNKQLTHKYIFFCHSSFKAFNKKFGRWIKCVSFRFKRQLMSGLNSNEIHTRLGVCHQTWFHFEPKLSPGIFVKIQVHLGLIPSLIWAQKGV